MAEMAEIFPCAYHYENQLSAISAISAGPLFDPLRGEI
jgi:hypothetical protein